MRRLHSAVSMAVLTALGEFCAGADTRSTFALEVLDCAFVLFGRCACVECTEVFALSSLRIHFA